MVPGKKEKIEPDSRQIILLTGPPRSGTSLACVLLNLVPNVAALVEPMKLNNIPENVSGQELHDIVEDFAAEMIASAVNRSELISKHSEDSIVSNLYTESDGSKRVSRVRLGALQLEGDFDESMTLVIKHPAAFTALSKKLRQYFDVFAIIRDPLYVLCSWNTIPANIGEGRLPMGERFDKELRNRLEACEDILERQIEIVNWFFEHYEQWDRDNIIKYEDIISSGGSVLESIVSDARPLKEDLTSQNDRARYPTLDIGYIERRLYQRGGAFLNFYPRGPA